MGRFRFRNVAAAVGSTRALPRRHIRPLCLADRKSGYRPLHALRDYSESPGAPPRCTLDSSRNPRCWARLGPKGSGRVVDSCSIILIGRLTEVDMPSKVLILLLLVT